MEKFVHFTTISVRPRRLQAWYRRHPRFTFWSSLVSYGVIAAWWINEIRKSNEGIKRYNEQNAPLMTFHHGPNGEHCECLRGQIYGACDLFATKDEQSFLEDYKVQSFVPEDHEPW